MVQNQMFWDCFSFRCVVFFFYSVYHDMENMFNCFTLSQLFKMDCCFDGDGCVYEIRDEKCAFDSIVSHWLTSTMLIKIRFTIMIIIIIKIILSNFRCPRFSKTKIPFDSFFGTFRLIFFHVFRRSSLLNHFANW